MSPGEAQVYGKMCGWKLARAHARSGDRIAIGVYLGKGEAFDSALAEFAVTYADQNERDYLALVAAVKSNRVKAEIGIYKFTERDNWITEQKHISLELVANAYSG